MRVGVVGAGITGLALTHHLAERDVDVVTFEADDEPGGVVRSGRTNGHVLEYGPQRARLAAPIADIVDDLDLRDEVLVADDDAPLYVYADRGLRTVPRSLRAFLATDLLSWRGKLRLLKEPLTDPIDPTESAADAFVRKFGHEAYRNVIEPLYGGIYGSDPARMPAEHALDSLATLEARHGSLLRAAIDRLVRGGDAPPPTSFADGLQRLPEALNERHEPYVHLGTPVEAAVDTPDDGYSIDAGGRTVAVDAVVLTVPAPAAANLLADVDGATADPLRDLTYNSLALVHLRADRDVTGFGYQVRRDEPLRTLGVTWNGGLFDRDGLFTAFLGGMHDPEVVELSDDEIGAIASEEFEGVMDTDASVLEVTRLPSVLPAYDETWSALDDVSIPDDVHLATNYTERLGIASRVRQARSIADELEARA